MAMFSKGRGVFGAPMQRNSWDTPGYGDGIAAETNPQGVSASPAAAALAPSTETYTAPKRTFLDKVGLLADAFRGTNENAMQLQAQDQQDYQRWQQTTGAQLARSQEFADWQRRQEYTAAHPGAAQEDAFTAGLRRAGIDPASAEGQQLYRQRAYTQASPAPNFVSDGAGGGRWVTPPAPGMGMGAPQMPVGKLTPLGGGATPQGARTFPVR